MTLGTLDRIGLRHGTDKASRGHNFLFDYEFFLAPYVPTSFILLEIGGLSGASLRMWEEYFPSARIVCLDINPEVARHAAERVHVEIGDAGNAAFLTSMAEKYGNPTVVIDDGSHRWDHQRIAFKTLFGKVAPGGVYIIEDLHTSFEPGFAGRDDLPVTELLFTLCKYLQLRKGLATAFEATFSKSVVDIAKSIQSITFLSRSCVIRKKAAEGAR